MTTAIENLSSNSDIVFSSTPNVLTMGSSDNSTKLASTAFVQSNISNSTSLDIASAQSLSATTITPTVNITTVDTTSAGTLQLGLDTDTNIDIGGSSTITMLGYLQPFDSIFRYLTTGCTNTTASLGTAVSVQKIYTGTAVMTTGSATITFSPPFTTIPTVVLGVVATNTTSALSTKWVQLALTNTAIIRCNPASSNVTMNWLAVGN
jgi:hypothetical protein